MRIQAMRRLVRDLGPIGSAIGSIRSRPEKTWIGFREAISRPWPILAFSFCVACAGLAASAEASVTAVGAPPADRSNSFYPSNRPPLAASPLVKLPIGAIKPKGWLLRMLELEAQGMVGRLPELSQWSKSEGNAWMRPSGDGHSPWEELPYWLKGFGDLGYVLGDARMIAEARQWIEAVLGSQEPDGWFGPRSNRTRLEGKPDAWPNMVMLNALQSFHEFTGDMRVLPFMASYFRWQLSVPEGDFLVPFWQKMRAGDNLESIHWLYNRTGEQWLLDVAAKVHRFTANWTQGIASWHGVNISQGFRQPAVFFVQARDPAFLRAAERNYDTVMGLYGQVPGGMFGADENCREGYYGPRQGAETCSMVEFMHSFEMLVKITGNPLWADRCEEVAFNSFPPSRTSDLKGLHYLTAPNMVQLDRHNKSPGLQNDGCMLAYNPWNYRCCQHNVSHGWPYYAEELWLATADDGLCASLYAASEVTAKVGDGTTVRIVETTDYPFGETVTLAVSTPKPVRFPLYLRIPRWCAGASIALNGRAVASSIQPLSYAVLNLLWADGDTVNLTMPAQVAVTVWAKNRNSVSVSRGPLTFSLEIGERWVRYGGTDKWPAWEVFPTTAWNYGLVLDPADPAAGFEVIVRPGPAGFTPESAPLELRARARRIPEWQQDELGLVGELQDSPAYTEKPVETVKLIPMGCARLRISAFPVAASGADGVRWKAPPNPAAASHLNPGDTTLALDDGQLPRSSNDHTIRRFTWWDHRGTTEWVAYSFEEPREVSRCEVYWFDDTGQGHCRVPKSWRILWRDGNSWREVEHPSGYGTLKDAFNAVTFDPVTTTGLKLEVCLQPQFSGGILEWRATGAR